MTARVDQPWHIYSQTLSPGGPTATRIEFTANPIVTFNGGIREQGKLITVNEKLYGVNVNYYENGVDFIQPVKIKSNGKTSVMGYIQYVVAGPEKSLPLATVSFQVALQ